MPAQPTTKSYVAAGLSVARATELRPGIRRASRRPQQSTAILPDGPYRPAYLMSQRNLLILYWRPPLSYACYVRGEQNPYARYVGQRTGSHR